MSFGWSLSDIALLVQLAYKTTQGARAACGKYDELTRETSSLHTILNRLHEEVAKPESSINRRKGAYKRELQSITSGCQDVLTQLDRILTKYNALSEKERSVRKSWKKIRFGNSAVPDVTDLRSRATYYTSTLSFFLNLVATRSVGKIERKMDRAGGDLKEIKSAVNTIAARMLAKAGDEGSVLTSYTNDDKGAWRELRRDLVKKGFGDSIVRKHRKMIMDYVMELGNRGAFDINITDEDLEMLEGDRDNFSAHEENEASLDLSSPTVLGASHPSGSMSKRSMNPDDNVLSRSKLAESPKEECASNASSKHSKPDQKPASEAGQRNQNEDIQRELEGQLQYGSYYVQSNNKIEHDSWDGPRPGWQVLSDYTVPMFIAHGTEQYEVDTLTMRIHGRKIYAWLVIKCFKDRISTILEMKSVEMEEDMSALEHSASLLQHKMMNELYLAPCRLLPVSDGRQIRTICARFMVEAVAQRYKHESRHNTQGNANLEDILRVILNWIREFEVTSGETMRRLSPTFDTVCRQEEEGFALSAEKWLQSYGLGDDKALLTFDDPSDKKIHKLLLETRDRLSQWYQQLHQAVYSHDIWNDQAEQLKEQDDFFETLRNSASELETLYLGFTGQEDPRLRRLQRELFDFAKEMEARWRDQIRYRSLVFPKSQES